MNRNVLHKMQIPLPPPQLIANFGQFAEHFRRGQRNLEEQNKVLAKTRDLLLPRLISGELNVDTLNLPEPP